MNLIRSLLTATILAGFTTASFAHFHDDNVRATYMFAQVSQQADYMAMQAAALMRSNPNTSWNDRYAYQQLMALQNEARQFAYAARQMESGWGYPGHDDNQIHYRLVQFYNQLSIRSQQTDPYLRGSWTLRPLFMYWSGQYAMTLQQLRRELRFDNGPMQRENHRRNLFDRLHAALH